MNLGKKINELRKSKNITQDEMAAELGVTAAAVSKWENGYTLPDILMLCALADYFQVTTDELLGRAKEPKYAVIAAETQALGLKIAESAKSHGMIVHGIYGKFEDAHRAAREHREITHILAGYIHSVPNELTDAVENGLHLCQSIGETDRKILDGFEMIFQHFI